MAALFIELIGLLYALIDQDLIFIVTASIIILTHLFLSSQKQLKPIFKLLFPGVILIYFTGSFFNFFTETSEYDSLLHFFSGFVVSLLFASLILKKSKSKKQKSQIFMIIAFGFLIGAAWEIFEVAADPFVIPEIGDTNDTVLDLIMDTLGAAVAALLAPIIFKK